MSGLCLSSSKIEMTILMQVKFGTEDVQRIVYVALEIVMESADDVVTQVGHQKSLPCKKRDCCSYRTVLSRVVAFAGSMGKLSIKDAALIPPRPEAGSAMAQAVHAPVQDAL